MANTATNVSVGKPKTAGAIYRAPSGTSLPADTSTELDEAFVCLGYVSEDGVTNSNEIDSDSIQAWGGDTVLPFQVSRTVSFQFTLIESLNVDVLKTVYGDDNVSGDLESGITIKANSDELPSSAWVIDMINRDGAYHRIVMTDILHLLLWAQTKDGQKNRNRPKSIVDALLNRDEPKDSRYDVRIFRSPEEFMNAWNRQTGGDHCGD